VRKIEIETFKFEISAVKKKYNVWEHKLIKEECRTPGVYVLIDIEGEIIYVGDSGNGMIDMIGDRVSRHIRGTSAQSKRGMQRYIYEIDIYEFGNTVKDKSDKKIIEEHLKTYYDQPVFSKDDFAFTTENSTDYLNPRNDKKLWKNYHLVDVSGEEDQKKIIESGLTLED